MVQKHTKWESNRDETTTSFLRKGFYKRNNLTKKWKLRKNNLGLFQESQSIMRIYKKKLERTIRGVCVTKA